MTAPDRWTITPHHPQTLYTHPLGDGRELRVEIQWRIGFTSPAIRRHLQSGGVQPPLVARLVRAGIYVRGVPGQPWTRERDVPHSAITLS